MIEPVEWPSQMAPLVPQLRRLQYAANMLNLAEFCEAQGWPIDDAYARDKFREFQKLGRLHVFDNHVLEAAITFYERQTARHEKDHASLCGCGHPLGLHGSNNVGSTLCLDPDHPECDCQEAHRA